MQVNRWAKIFRAYGAAFAAGFGSLPPTAKLKVEFSRTPLRSASTRTSTISAASHGRPEPGVTCGDQLYRRVQHAAQSGRGLRISLASPAIHSWPAAAFVVSEKFQPLPSVESRRPRQWGEVCSWWDIPPR